MLLTTVEGLDIVGEAADGREALAVIARRDPDVVLADVRMPGMDGIDRVARYRIDHPGLPVLLTTFDDEPVVQGSRTLVLAESTVKNHVSALLRKIGARGRTGLELVLYKTLSR